MDYKIINKITTLFLISFLIACSTDQKKDDAPIEIEGVRLTKQSSRAPKENDFQSEIELQGIVSSANIKQDITYKWYIEYLKLDIEDELNNNLSNTDLSEDNIIINSTFLEGYYFLEVSKDPLDAMLSIYQPGYYKITLNAYNINETKEYSLILKMGEPEFPDLFVKVNIPKLDAPGKNDFKGNFFLSVNNSKTKSSSTEIININAEDTMDNWYDTGIKFNPFNSFNIQSGTHVITSNEKKYLLSLNKNSSNKELASISYSINDNEKRYVNFTPILLEDSNGRNTLKIDKDNEIKWDKGNIFLSFLTWGFNKKNEDEFIFFEKKLNNVTPNIITDFKNKYLVKIFIGSFGHKVIPNNYFVYFGPDGTDTEELDPKNEREIPGLPYGYLLGKLGENGSIFPIGNDYTYTHENSHDIYQIDENNNFVKIN